ncbi:SDR family oxidoreductase [Terrilactibacillus sp. BCM23-1]|uniref:SDR family oxidoreductase n=1 Tax=Terrilactibacillus tamarindi TaxID=2599694 RepID=A0A6N8CQG4_9BACI|nr:SDR family oxidoreductase [Terrilactibacillus tamarindi]MTT31900.1 SDR family oxidoreductase [Terrilactibacillus tamarindi]
MYPEYPYYSSTEKCEEVPLTFPPQHQNYQPGMEYLMNPKPIFENPNVKGSQKLLNKVAVISGGDSGIGRAAAVAFAKEGADVAIIYLNEHEDAAFTKQRIEQLGRRCLAIPADLQREANSVQSIQHVVSTFGRVDILVNNCAVQYPQRSILNISEAQLDHTFRTNIYSFFFLTKAALPYMGPGSSIINTTSVNAYRGHKTLLDYTSTKGAIVGFTRALALNLVEKDIRVNQIAPGPVWTPLIVSSFSAEEASSFGADAPMKRAAQPFELADAYVYLASDSSRYVTGECIHINGGGFVGG